MIFITTNLPVGRQGHKGHKEKYVFSALCSWCLRGLINHLSHCEAMSNLILIECEFCL